MTDATSGRTPVAKTYKLFVKGAFPRSESGRSYPVTGHDGRTLAWAAQASRKDARDAVQAARGALGAWSAATAFNRGQVLYRVAEVLEGRAAQLVAELTNADGDREGAQQETDTAIDRWVWYSGWADKIATVAGSANPVAGPYFNFTVPEPTGVVAVIAPERPALLGIVSLLAPVLAGGNTVVAVASPSAPLPAITLGEVLATSDVPPGVVNVLSGRQGELAPVLAAHGDVDAIDLTGIADAQLATDCERRAAGDIKRVLRPFGREPDWFGASAQCADAVLATMELKTVWHPKAP